MQLLRNKKLKLFFAGITAYLLYDALQESITDKASNSVRSFSPPSTGRSLSLNLGGGNCEWQPPLYDIPEEIDFYKTAIVGFPSGDKRMIFIQMEALAGWGKCSTLFL